MSLGSRSVVRLYTDLRNRIIGVCFVMFVNEMSPVVSGGEWGEGNICVRGFKVVRVKFTVKD